jgi:uncharacterized membrane protein (DUF373 family)
MQERSLYRRAAGLLDHVDRLVYSIVAILFLVAALAMAVYSVDIFVTGETDFPFRLITFVNDLLLVLIIMEVLSTVRTYLARGHTSLYPFLYIGIISATRRILAVGAEATLRQTRSDIDFQREMVELAVNAGVVLALALALFVFRPANDAT